MKKNKKLSEYHKSNRKFLHVIPVFSVAAIIMGTIEAVTYSQMRAYGLSLIGIGVFFIIVYFIALVFTNNYIKKLQNEELQEEENKKELEDELKMRDERIKELEELVNNSHTDG